MSFPLKREIPDLEVLYDEEVEAVLGRVQHWDSILNIVCNRISSDPALASGNVRVSSYPDEDGSFRHLSICIEVPGIEFTLALEKSETLDDSIADLDRDRQVIVTVLPP